MSGPERFAPAGILIAGMLAAFPWPLLTHALHAGPAARPAPASRLTSATPPPLVHLRLTPLTVPVSVQPRTYSLGPGDTPWGIAQTWGATAGALDAAHSFFPGALLHAGQRLVAMRLPSGAPALREGAETIAHHLRLFWPSSGTVTSRFGWRIHPIFGTREFHTGVDIATRWGSPVLAARSGIVRFAGWMAGYGRLVVLDHGSGLETVYSHLSTVLVGRGQRVTEGEMIGRIGSTGWSTGPHLFFEVRRNGVAEDPTRYLH